MSPCSWVRSGLYSSRLAGIWTCRPSSRRVPRSSADAGRLHITPLSACTTRISRSSEGIPTEPAPTGGLFDPPAPAQGERSGAASPWTPAGPHRSLALHSLPTAWGYTRSPYGRRKRAQRSLVRRGTDAARPPATPSAAGCAGAATAVAAASTADGPRGARPRARAATRSRTLRRHGGRTPSRARTEPRTSPRAGRGAWWRLPCRPLTGRALPRRLSQEQKRRAAGS